MRTVDLIGFGVTPHEIELAEKIQQHVPSAERVVLLATGTEATFYAVRLARGVTGRRLLVKFQGCFHGGPRLGLAERDLRRHRLGRRTRTRRGSSRRWSTRR